MKNSEAMLKKSELQVKEKGEYVKFLHQKNIEKRKERLDQISARQFLSQKVIKHNKFTLNIQDYNMFKEEEEQKLIRLKDIEQRHKLVLDSKKEEEALR